MTSSTFKYDVYISHAKADRAWVEKQLIPRLIAAKLLYCIEFEHFEPGAITLSEVEKKIIASRKILLVISANYLKNELSTFENHFAKHLDTSTSERRSIPIIIAQCKLPNSIKQLVKISLTAKSVASREKEWNRLIDYLNGLSSEKDLNKSTEPKKAKYPLMRRIEKELRMKTKRKYHWINTGFSIPPENFNFTAVYFENQLEVLAGIQNQIGTLIDLLVKKRINPNHTNFLDQAYEILSEIDIRTDQIIKVIRYENEHPLCIVAQKAVDNYSSKSETLRKMLVEIPIRGILAPTEITQLNRELASYLRILAISGQELQKHLKKIYDFVKTDVYVD